MANYTKKRIFKINKDQKTGRCRIIENGKKCNRPIHCRGVCPRHHTYLLRWHLLEKYGAKQKFVYFDKTKYKVNPNPNLKHCRILENRKPCKRKLHGRGLCARHWLQFDRHGVLKKFGTTSRKDPRDFAVKVRIVKGVCRIKENKKDCKNASTSRGLCSKHYLRFLRDGRIKKFGKTVDRI